MWKEAPESRIQGDDIHEEGGGGAEPEDLAAEPGVGAEATRRRSSVSISWCVCSKEL